MAVTCSKSVEWEWSFDYSKPMMKWCLINCRLVLFNWYANGCWTKNLAHRTPSWHLNPNNDPLNRTSTRARTRCGQDAESTFVNPHSFRNLSAYSWTCPQPVLIPSGLLPRTLLQSIQREQWFPHLSVDRIPKWHNLLPQHLVRAL